MDQVGLEIGRGQQTILTVAKAHVLHKHSTGKSQKTVDDQAGKQNLSTEQMLNFTSKKAGRKVGGCKID